MRKPLSLLGLALVTAACEPNIPQVEPKAVVVARFDPSRSPPLVPTPNDLATDPKTGLLAVPVSSAASDADQEFTAYLNSLDGFPASASATATFDGALDAESVNAGSVLVVDLGAQSVIGDVSLQYLDTPHGAAAGSIVVKPPPGGWTAGARYAVAVLGGESGVKGAEGAPVVGSSTWALLRSEHSLVTCEDLESPDCQSVTALIPSKKSDPAEKLAEQAAKAVQLEGLRRKYAPAIEAVLETGAQRTDIALLWTFKISSFPNLGFNPAAVPPVVPVPNDLAMDPETGLVKAPIDPLAPSAMQEFTRDYLNTLDGFPVSASGSAIVVNGDLEASSVGPSTVLLVDLAAADAGTPVVTTTSYDAARHTVSISPPATGWPKGGRFAVAVVTSAPGINGVKSTSGKPVVASDVFALVRSEASLVTCQNLKDVSCRPDITVAPLELAQALQLEAMRRGYAPVFEQLAGSGIRRKNVALLWTFRVVSRAEATFDPAASVIPFPNNLLLDNDRVKLPIPSGASAMMTQLISGLNTLDGFSLTAPAVSENSDALGALDHGAIDPATLADGGTGFLKLTPGGTAPQVKVCLNCASSALADGGIPESPQQLQFVPTVPLDEKSTYAAYLTTGIKDLDGNRIIASPTFALMRSESSLLEGTKSTVSGVSDAQAAQLEPARLAMKPLIDALVAGGVPRKEIALAWAYRTQSVHAFTPEYATLKGLYALPAQMGTVSALPSVPDYLVDVSAMVLPTLPLPKANISKVFSGTMPVLFLLNGPGGTFSVPPPVVTKRIPFLISLPAIPAPGGGYPVVVFGHGLKGNRAHMLSIADSFAAAGIATIATDVVWHGERTSCLGSKSATGFTTDDASCADPVNQLCDSTSGRCIARVAATRAACNPASPLTGDLACMNTGKGACVPDAPGSNTYVCEGGDFLRDAQGGPVISGWNILNLTNLFATRDNFRQQVVDLSQLTRVISDTTTTGNLNASLTGAGASAGLNPGKIHYAGISLGGILGTLFNSVATNTHHVALNVPGGDLTGVLLDAPAFAPQKAAFLATLASQGITQGTPGFDNFISIARWILDPADPQNVGYQLTHGTTLPADRKALIHYISYDLVVPNSATAKLIAGANRGGDPKQCSVYQANPSLTALPLKDRHGFLLNFANQTVTGLAQQHVVMFVSTGVAP